MISFGRTRNILGRIAAVALIAVWPALMLCSPGAYGADTLNVYSI